MEKPPPVVVYTGTIDPSVPRQVMALGGAGFVSKSEPPEHLLTTLSGMQDDHDCDVSQDSECMPDENDSKGFIHMNRGSAKEVKSCAWCRVCVVYGNGYKYDPCDKRCEACGY
jgi:hypothetical protein